ncbi:MAG: glycosyltransferase [Proteobacteria bacterium]|nr:glycosyltransferase [Pseudomonadota bacterium]
METNVGKILEYLKSVKISYEVVLVNDGSTDSTEAICQSIVKSNRSTRLISYPVNRGKGYAVKTGMLESKGIYRLFMDADLAVPARFIQPCIRQLQEGADMVIGSRNFSKSSVKVPEGSLRRFLGGVYLRLVRRAFNLGVSDITCGLKGFEENKAYNIFSRSKIERWGYDAEIIFLARKLGYNISEIPVDWYHSFDSKVKVALDSVRTFIEMLQIYCNYRKGRYIL